MSSSIHFRNFYCNFSLSDYFNKKAFFSHLRQADVIKFYQRCLKILPTHTKNETNTLKLGVSFQWQSICGSWGIQITITCLYCEKTWLLRHDYLVYHVFALSMPKISIHLGSLNSEVIFATSDLTQIFE